VHAVEGVQSATPLRFQGQYEDGETGLYYNRFRYYDPEAALYLSPDPIGLNGGLRLYGYGANPVRWVDPLGLLPDPPPPPTPKGTQLPGYDGKKTEGVLVRPDGSEQHLRSGYDGPTDGTRFPGLNGNIKAHVEGHATAIMRREGLPSGTLYINRNPCPGRTGCDQMLPRMLPPGATLTVVGPAGATRTYAGATDHPRWRDKTRL
jgi:RHS repeat-associated protein